MHLDANYNLCSKLGSKLIFDENYGSFSFARPFYNFDCIFPRWIFLKVGPDKIYAGTGGVLRFARIQLYRGLKRKSSKGGPGVCVHIITFRVITTRLRSKSNRCFCRTTLAI